MPTQKKSMKKSFIFIITFFTSNVLKAQDSSFVINGKLEKIKSGTIYLNIYEGQRTVKDSALINNGIFKFPNIVAAYNQFKNKIK